MKGQNATVIARRERLGKLGVAVSAVVVLAFAAGPLGAEVFCNAAGKDPRLELMPTKALPWGAVGYLNNGCTATLVSQRTLVTAAHCVVNVGNGSWQKGIYFAPNFHPSKPSTFHRIDRAVVGTRADVGYLDWAIAHLETPAYGFPTMKLDDPPATVPFRVTSAGYGRDLNRTKPQPKPTGAPCGPPNPFCPGGNVWWDKALIDPSCSVRVDDGYQLLTDCSVVGGNSGSPLVHPLGRPGSRSGEFRLVGLIHGGSPALLNWAKGAPTRQQKALSPACTTRAAANDQKNLNGGPAADRFRGAPLFATGVGIAAAGSGTKRSQVFIADRDGYRIVSRERADADPKTALSAHRFLSFLPAPMRLAAFSQPSGNPGLAAITSQGRLFVNLAAGPADWGPWQELDKPPGSAAVRDLDALEGGDAELYVVTSDGRAFRRRLQGSSWGQWVALPGSGFERISAVRRTTGQRLVFLGDAAHDVWVSRQSGTGWITGFKQPLSFRGGMPFTLIDFDAVRGSDGLVQFFGVDGATGTLWTRREESKLANEFKWESWRKWDVRLFVTDESFKATASQAALKYGFWQETAGPALDEVATIAATRWPENDKTVVFATDDGGNVYSTEPRCASSAAATCYWAGWRPFAE